MFKDYIETIYGITGITEMSPLNIENCPKDAIFNPRHLPTVQCTWPAPMRRSVLGRGRLDFHGKYMGLSENVGLIFPMK